MEVLASRPKWQRETERLLKSGQFDEEPEHQVAHPAGNRQMRNFRFWRSALIAAQIFCSICSYVLDPVAVRQPVMSSCCRETSPPSNANLAFEKSGHGSDMLRDLSRWS